MVKMNWFCLTFQRYPCLGETLAHDIILKRHYAPLKHLKEVWNLEGIRNQLLGDVSPVVDDSIEYVCSYPFHIFLEKTNQIFQFRP